MHAGPVGLTAHGRILRAVLATGIATVLGVCALLPPDLLPVPGCLFRELSGLSCPTCGLTRSVHMVALGQVGEAFRLHLFGPLAVAGGVCVAALWGAEAWLGRSLVRRLPRHGFTRGFAVLAGLWMLFGVLRVLIELLTRN